MAENTTVPQEDMAQDLPPYIQREDCTEEMVNSLIKLGYTPWQITPKTQELRKGPVLISIETKLIYHFIRKRVK
ncbi:MAG: hypothetical protein HF312_17250 [Ignavibacteria bacterium]|jgi:Holliday junction resolvasome RuvABC DNA-binding subunit|nr:hypothetical protein [Ignavibacteria bacterium]